MQWNIPSPEVLARRLAPREGLLDMVLDTDTYNEVDDQFALCYSLLSPTRLNVQAVYAAPFHNDRSTSPGDGMEKSYDEILRLMRAMGRAPEGMVYKGSTSYLPNGDTPVDSPAARDLVQRGMSRAQDDPLYVVAIGAITNVASALLMEPRLAEKIVVVWLGGDPLHYPHTQEFNLSQDVPAARVIFDCGAPVVLIPCMGVASHLLVSVQELALYLGGQNPVCDALVKLTGEYHDDHFAWSKEIWDISTIAYMVNPDWMPSVLMHSPLLTDDSHWAQDTRRHMIRVAYFAERNVIFRDMYRKLRGEAQ